MVVGLVKRVETLEGPDRETDWMIYKALGHELILLGEIPVWRRGGAQWPAAQDSVPRFTSSLDAAQSLLLEHRWSKRVIASDINNEYVVEIWDDEVEYSARAATEALALCAAALRAREEI